MQPDFAYHPAKIEKASYFFGWTAKGNSCHEKIWTFCREVQAWTTNGWRKAKLSEAIL
jgi:hypothetical protein